MLFSKKKTSNNSRVSIKTIANTNTKSEYLNEEFYAYRASRSDMLGWVTASNAWAIFQKASPVFNAISLISKEFSGLMPKIYNIKEKKFEDPADNKVPLNRALQLLLNPSSFTTGIEFRKQTANSYHATGDIFIYITAKNPDSEPLELYYINPVDMEINIATDGMPKSYEYRRLDKSITFYRTGIKDYRYLTKDGTKEIWHIKTFNPRQGSRSGNNDYRGMSPMMPIILEIESYVEAYLHNRSLLKNGQRMSGMFLADKNLSQRQFDNLMMQIKTEIQGAQNNGEIIVLDGIEQNGLKFVPLSEVAKDLDFRQLIENSRQQVQRIYDIPAPLVELNTQKYDNFISALAVFHRMTIFPFADEYYTEINCFIKRRYKNSEDYMIWYDKMDVDAVADVELDNAIKKIKSNRLTDNEGRRLLGYEEIEGGDIISKDQKQVAELSIEEKSDNFKYNANSKVRLRHMLENTYKANGDKAYTEEQIKQAIERYNGNIESNK